MFMFSDHALNLSLGRNIQVLLVHVNHNNIIFDSSGIPSPCNSFIEIGLSRKIVFFCLMIKKRIGLLVTSSLNSNPIESESLM